MENNNGMAGLSIRSVIQSMLPTTDTENMEDENSRRSVTHDVASMHLGVCDWCFVRIEYTEGRVASGIQYGFGDEHHVPDIIFQIHDKAVRPNGR